MRKNLTRAAMLMLAAAATPALADLVVTTDLGTLNAGQYTLSGSTVGKANNASVYSTVSNTTTVAWDRGEYVYQFTLTKPAFLFLTDTAEPDAGVLTPVPDHDYFLLPSLATFATDNTTAYYAGTGKPEATSIGFVQNSTGPSTPGSSANSGIFRSAGPTATNPNNPVNPYGIYGAGTYFISVDPRGGTGLNNQNAGNFFANFNVAYLDELSKPASTATVVQAGSTISGAYAAGDVEWFSFDYTGGAFTVTTQGNTIAESGGDTFLALYRDDGGLVKFNDDVGTGPAWSSLSVTAGEIPNGRYYLGFTEYKGEANSGFNLRVYPTSAGSSGTWVINGLALAPLTIPGDENNDGVVDLVDLNNVLNNFGDTGAPGITGDESGDGVVDLVDLNAVLNNFGDTAPTSALSVVPEPATFSLLALGAVAAFGRRRRS